MVEKSVKYQCFVTICANIATLAHGTAVGWLSPFLPLLMSDDSPLKFGPINIEEASWIASLLCVGAFLGTLVFGWAADKFGRKISAIVIAIPQAICWLCIIFAQSVMYLYIARLLIGFAAGGVYVLIPLYISEIAETSIRGILGSIFVFSINLGILSSYIMGTYIKYFIVQIILLFIPIIYMIFFIFLPETPHYLMKNNKREKAEESLKYLRGLNGVTNITDIPESFTIEFNALCAMYVNCETKIESNKLTLNDFKTTAAKKSILIGIGLISMNQFSGLYALVNYTATIFEDAETGLDSNISAIIIGVILFLGSIAATYFVDRIGRRILYLISSLGCSLGLSVMAIYSCLKDFGVDITSINWIPIVSLSFVIFIASTGVLPLGFVIISEILPSKIRSIGISFCMLLLWIMAFIIIKFFPTLVELMGMYGLMFFFSVYCSFAFILFFLFVPETKGKNFDEILESLESTKKKEIL